jgi:hypothetical protein
VFVARLSLDAALRTRFQERLMSEADAPRNEVIINRRVSPTEQDQLSRTALKPIERGSARCSKRNLANQTVNFANCVQKPESFHHPTALETDCA